MNLATERSLVTKEISVEWSDWSGLEEDGGVTVNVATTENFPEEFHCRGL